MRIASRKASRYTATHIQSLVRRYGPNLARIATGNYLRVARPLRNLRSVGRYPRFHCSDDLGDSRTAAFPPRRISVNDIAAFSGGAVGIFVDHYRQFQGVFEQASVPVGSRLCTRNLSIQSPIGLDLLGYHPRSGIGDLIRPIFSQVYQRRLTIRCSWPAVSWRVWLVHFGHGRMTFNPLTSSGQLSLFVSPHQPACGRYTSSYNRSCHRTSMFPRQSFA